MEAGDCVATAVVSHLTRPTAYPTDTLSRWWNALVAPSVREARSPGFGRSRLPFLRLRRFPVVCPEVKHG